MMRGVEDGSLHMADDEFLEFRDYLQKIAGIDLASNKKYLVSTRIRGVMLEFECETLEQLTNIIKKSTGLKARQRVVDAMTTNETYWFRDKYPFEVMKKTILPEIYKNNSSGPLRIWSSACSSGQEPYSLSMSIDEYIRATAGVLNLRAEITATDLSSAVLTQAKEGVYDKLSISRGLSEERLRNYFDPVGEDRWQAKEKVRKRVTFRPINLQDNYAILGKFDVVFCRNVLIYFSSQLKEDIITRIHGTLRPGGYFFLGASESLQVSSKLFEIIYCNPGVVYKAK